MELICPAGTPASLEAAVEAGADAIYCGFRDETNARNFPGLNFSRADMLATCALIACETWASSDSVTVRMTLGKILTVRLIFV